MKKIILFNLIYHTLLFIIPLIILLIAEGYGSEIFAYALYFSLLYFVIGFISDCLVLGILQHFNVKRFKWSLFALCSAIIFILTFYVLI